MAARKASKARPASKARLAELQAEYLASLGAVTVEQEAAVERTMMLFDKRVPIVRSMCDHCGSVTAQLSVHPAEEVEACECACHITARAVAERAKKSKSKGRKTAEVELSEPVESDAA